MPTREENSQKERNKALIRSFIKEVLKEHNLLAIEKYFTKDFIEGVLHHAEKEGEGFKQFLTEFFEAFPDMRTTIEHIV
ncbi:MAG: ester cyclase, partial [Nitrososphaeraceae archaeon]